jgi:hypothetical protein
MSTNQAIIDQALGELGIVEAGDSANATDSATALNTLNNLMAQWAENSRDLDWFPQDDLTAEAPLERWTLAGVISSLAIECAPEFRVPVNADLMAKAERGVTTITNRLINTSLEPSDLTFMNMGGRYRGWDIETGQ